MGELFRSQPMQLVQLFVQIEAAHDTLDELGQLQLIQFRDLNPDVSAFQRNFVNEVKRCNEMQRKLRYFQEMIGRLPMNEDGRIIGLLPISEDDETTTKVNSMDDLEVKFEEIERELLELTKNHEMLERNQTELVEMHHVLSRVGEFFSDPTASASYASEVVEQFDDVQQQPASQDIELQPMTISSSTLGFITGVIERTKVQTFERVLWRVMRGNLFFRTREIDDLLIDERGEFQEKNVFIVFFQGNRARGKAQKICESFGAHLYPIPEVATERPALHREVSSRMHDLETVLDKSAERRTRVLSSIHHNLLGWQTAVAKEKAIYHTMNLFNYDVGRRCLIAEGWCPEYATNEIQLALRRANERSGALVPSILSVIESTDTPPTCHSTTDFSRAFQDIVDMYGIATYREVNPGLFSIITFPFCFAIMFGDVGHGTLLLLFALYVLFKGKQAGEGLYYNRYMLLFMGIFATYCGFVYNECFSQSMSIFPSAMEYPCVKEKQGVCVQYEEFAVLNTDGYRYPFGVDPLWKGSANELDYYNSLKMKMSVLIGVTHMVFGIILSLYNHIHFKKAYNIWCEFVPQMLFMLSIFGYMCFLVVLKWLINWDNRKMDPPRLLNVLIAMTLTPFDMPKEYQIFPGQHYIQVILLFIAAICVPWMLLIKPYLLRRDHLRSRTRYGVIGEEMEVEMTGQTTTIEGELDDEEEFEFSEVAIHQVIHTIEFVLGCISNTASYLRLWALSLAHSELATVFWDRLLAGSLRVENVHFLGVFIGFAAWGAMNLGVLMGMESISAVLHALRLHWVEWMNKFYGGTGHAFRPFTFEISEDDL